jgi:hypothetical protein
MFADTLAVLFLPFLLYLFWGPFAFVYVAKRVVQRMYQRYSSAERARMAAFGLLLAIFLPVSVTSEGGNIPVIFPLWLALLGKFMPAGVDFSLTSFIFAIPILPIIWFYVAKEIRRQLANE